MRAMVLVTARTPLVVREQRLHEPVAGEILIEVGACGVCRTDLHVVDGELPDPKLPLVPGHELPSDPPEGVARLLRPERGEAADALHDPAELGELGLAEHRAEEPIDARAAAVDLLAVEAQEQVCR